MRRFTILAAACAVAFVFASSAHAGPRMYFGFLDDTSFRWNADREGALDAARGANASVLRTIVHWDHVAPERPLRASSPWDPAYNFDDLDEFVRGAQQRGFEVLLTIWGTPAWANGGAAPNVPPTDADDFREFTRAVALRYSGLFPGYPFARFISIWNEPNSPRFLAADDRAAAYAKLAAAGYDGAKAGSPGALVAIGETASRHCPATFMQAVAKADPELRFDAWAHHPYPPTGDESPDARAQWPDVGLQELGRFGDELDEAFGRTDVPLWVSEYAESTTAVTPVQQALDLRRTVELAARVPRVQMLVWLMLRDHPGEPWQSGLLGKPAYVAFRRAARAYDPRNARVEVDPNAPRHVVRVPALELRWHIPARAGVGIRYTLSACGRSVKTGLAGAPMQADGWVPVRLAFRARPTVRYRLDVEIEDVHGFSVRRRLELVPQGTARARCKL